MGLRNLYQQALDSFLMPFAVRSARSARWLTLGPMPGYSGALSDALSYPAGSFVAKKPEKIGQETAPLLPVHGWGRKPEKIRPRYLHDCEQRMNTAYPRRSALDCLGCCPSKPFSGASPPPQPAGECVRALFESRKPSCHRPPQTGRAGKSHYNGGSKQQGGHGAVVGPGGTQEVENIAVARESDAWRVDGGEPCGPCLSNFHAIDRVSLDAVLMFRPNFRLADDPSGRSLLTVIP